MAEREAPLLVLAADVGNNSSIWLLWRGCQAREHFLFILAEGTATEMQNPSHAGPEAARDDTACCELPAALSYPRGSNLPAGHSSYGPKPGSVARGHGRVEHCRRRRSLGNSQTRPHGKSKAAGGVRIPTRGLRTRFQQPKITAPLPLLPLRWFNMRESKCTIQNLKTGLWFVPCLLRTRGGDKAKGSVAARPRGAAGGVDMWRTSIPPPGRLLQHTQHDALAQLFRLSLAKGLEGPQPSGARAGPWARSLLFLVSFCCLLFGGLRRLLGGRALLIAGDREMRAEWLAGSDLLWGWAHVNTQPRAWRTQEPSTVCLGLSQYGD